MGFFYDGFRFGDRCDGADGEDVEELWGEGVGVEWFLEECVGHDVMKVDGEGEDEGGR